MDPFLGEIRCFAFGYAPVGWLPCEGQLLAIASNTALFSLLGTNFGGDGRSTFALPDLRGRVPLGRGQGPGLADYYQGQAGGTEQVTLEAAQIPAHAHTVAASSAATTGNPDGALPAQAATEACTYGTTADVAMSAEMIGASGGGGAHENLPPYLALTWCIATQGVYPARV